MTDSSNVKRLRILPVRLPISPRPPTSHELLPAWAGRALNWRPKGILKRLLLSKARLHLMATVPTLVVAFYYAFVASDLYSSESKFMIRGRQQMSLSSPLAQMLNMTGLTRAYDETYTVGDFVVSREAMNGMNKELDLRQVFNRPGVDFLSKFWWGKSNEDLLAYYCNKVKFTFDSNSNISTLTTFAFTPEDAQKINLILLRLSEIVVNRLNTRAQQDSVELAQGELKLAEDKAKRARIEMTKFRKRDGTLDPTASSLVVTKVISALEDEAATTESQIGEMEELSVKDNPRLLGLNNRLKALNDQIEEQRSRLTGDSDNAYADQIEDYEQLEIDDKFADGRLVAATQAEELARVDAERQNLYLIRIVEPAIPDDASYPKRILNTATVFVVLLVLYWLSTLIWTASKEHKS